MKPAGTAALKRAGGPAKNPVVKTTGTKAVAPKGNSVVRVPKQDDMRFYEVRSAMDTLMRAEDIKKDKRMMDDVKRMVDEQAKKMAKVC